MNQTSELVIPERSLITVNNTLKTDYFQQIAIFKISIISLLILFSHILLFSY